MDASIGARPVDYPDAPHAQGPPGPPQRSDDLFTVADDVAAQVGGPVILEDASFRVLAYSAFVGPMDRGRAEAILGRRTPEAWLEHLAATGSLARLRTTTEVVDLPDGPWEARRRLITAVRVGRRRLGVVWVAEGEVPLPAGAADALRRAADDLVPHLLRHLERTDAERDRRRRHVHTLLSAHDRAQESAAELGFGPGSALAVLAVSTREGGPDQDPDEEWSRLADHVRLCCESFRRVSAIAPFGRGALAVVAVPTTSPEESAERLGHEIVRLAGTGPLAPLSVAVSSASSQLDDMPRLREEAVGAMAVLEAQDGHRCATFRELEAEVLVRDVVARLPPGTGLSGLRRLVEHDARHGGALVATLRAHLAAGGTASEAAEHLGVHVTTLRHRLRRIGDVSGLRLEDPTVRLACDLVLRRAAW